MDINYEKMQRIGIYDYVSQNYLQMSKKQLANICKELFYAIRNECGREVSDECEDVVINSLIDMGI